MLPWLCLCCGLRSYSGGFMTVCIKAIELFHCCCPEYIYIYIYGAKWGPLGHCGFIVLTYSTVITKCNYFGIVVWKIELKNIIIINII